MFRLVRNHGWIGSMARICHAMNSIGAGGGGHKQYRMGHEIRRAPVFHGLVNPRVCVYLPNKRAASGVPPGGSPGLSFISLSLSHRPLWRERKPASAK